VSATYVHFGGNRGGILLDSGEGTFGQLVRRFGSDEALQIILSLNCIFISHIHADHHLGLIRILCLRNELISRIKNPESIPPLLVVGPRTLAHWMAEFVKCEPDNLLHLSYRYIDCNEFLNNNVFKPEFVAVPYQNVIKTFQTVEVIHCPSAYGLIFEVNSLSEPNKTFKIVYSGDTRPCPALINAGKNATILIHEATFEDTLFQEAVEKNHSTTSEAVNSALAMNADLVMLFHFSQRYPKIPVIQSEYAHQKSRFSF